MGRFNPIDAAAQLIDVCLIIFPDGTTHYFTPRPVFINTPNQNVIYIQEMLGKWYDSNKARYAGIDMSQLHPTIGNMKMFRIDFDKQISRADFGQEDN